MEQQPLPQEVVDAIEAEIKVRTAVSPRARYPHIVDLIRKDLAAGAEIALSVAAGASKEVEQEPVGYMVKHEGSEEYCFYRASTVAAIPKILDEPNYPVYASPVNTPLPASVDREKLRQIIREEIVAAIGYVPDSDSRMEGSFGRAADAVIEAVKHISPYTTEDTEGEIKRTALAYAKWAYQNGIQKTLRGWKDAVGQSFTEDELYEIFSAESRP